MRKSHSRTVEGRLIIVQKSVLQSINLASRSVLSAPKNKRERSCKTYIEPASVK